MKKFSKSFKQSLAAAALLVVAMAGVQTKVDAQAMIKPFWVPAVHLSIPCFQKCFRTIIRKQAYR